MHDGRMTRQEPQARGRKARRCHGMAMDRVALYEHPQQSVSPPAPSKEKGSFKSGQPFGEPVCLFSDNHQACNGEESTEVSHKTRKMTYLLTSPHRQSSQPPSGAHRNGLWDVKKARTRPQYPPSDRLALCFQNFCGENGHIWR
jgi:hypothetical protein